MSGIPCQHITGYDTALTAENAVVVDVPIKCGNVAPAYRQCGAGCKLIKAYCEPHGGDARAASEMLEHSKTVHGIETELKL